MLEEIKKELINHPDKLKNILEHFGYCNIVVRPKYIQCGRDEESSRKSIVIKLKENRYLYVSDYARNIQQDLFTYIINQRHVEFSDVLNVVKNELGITDYYDFFDNKSKGIFGGFYDDIKSKNEYSINVYDNSILDYYVKCGNLRFLRDNISLASQNFFNIRYDVESQGIVIPIYDQIGQLMGVKVRCNYDVTDGEQKYFYLIPCAISMTLYGYSQNYAFLEQVTIYIFEAEKSTLQCHSYGIRNCVSLGSGSISTKQVEMLLELNPKRVIFMHDTGYKLENIMRNIELLKGYSKFSEMEVGYWDYFDRLYDDKLSPSDLGELELKRIMKDEIKIVGEDDEEL